MIKRICIRNQGKGAKIHPAPVALFFASTSGALTHTAAFKLEYRIKQAPAVKKRQLIFKFPGDTE